MLRHAGEQTGASVQLWYAPVTPGEQRRRHELRLAAEPHSTWPLSYEELATWAAVFEAPTQGELTGREPIDAPPTGFASWSAWIGHRWPARV